MKIDLKKKIRRDPNSEPILALGEMLEQGLWRSTNAPRDLYDKIKGQDEVDLTAKENASLQEAIKGQFVSGVEWQIIDILEAKDE